MRRKASAFVQIMGHRSSALGPVVYIRIRREDYAPMGWDEIWQTFVDAYPDRWAVQTFPPVEEVVNEANIYHLFVFEERPKGLTI